MNPTEHSRRLCRAFAGLVLERRKALGLSHRAVPELAGLTRPAISFVESGKRIPTLDTVSRLALALGMTSAKLVAEAEAQAAKP